MDEEEEVEEGDDILGLCDDGDCELTSCPPVHQQFVQCSG